MCSEFVCSVGTDETGQFLDIDFGLRHAPPIIQESECNANTKTVSTPREKFQDKLGVDGRKSQVLKKNMQHDTDLRA